MKNVYIGIFPFKRLGVILVLLLLCLFAKPIATVCAEDQAVDIKEMISRKKGELIKKGEITLNDAALALEAALGITALEGDSFWAADLLDEGAVSLENAQIILNAALGIEDVEAVLLKNGDYFVKNYMSFEVKTDRKAYHPGENIPFKLTIKNNASVPFFAIHSGSRCVECALVDENDKEYAIDRVVEDNGSIGMTCEVGYFLIQPEETLELDHTINNIPEDLEGENLETKDFYIEVNFKYTDPFDVSDYDALDDALDERRYYTVKFPVNITNEI